MSAIGERLWIKSPAGAAEGHRCTIVRSRHIGELDGKRRFVVTIRLIEDKIQLDVDPADIVDAVPLSRADQARYHELDQALAGKERPPVPEWSEFNRLRIRSLLFGDEP